MLVGKQLSNGKYQPLAIVEFGFKREEKTAFTEISQRIETKVEGDVMDRTKIALQSSIS